MWELVLSLEERQSHFRVHTFRCSSWLLSIHVNMLKFWPEANNNYKKDRKHNKSRISSFFLVLILLFPSNIASDCLTGAPRVRRLRLLNFLNHRTYPRFKPRESIKMTSAESTERLLWTTSATIASSIDCQPH